MSRAYRVSLTILIFRESIAECDLEIPLYGCVEFPYLCVVTISTKNSFNTRLLCPQGGISFITMTMRWRTDGRHLFVSKQILDQVYIASSVCPPLFDLQINEGLSGPCFVFQQITALNICQGFEFRSLCD